MKSMKLWKKPYLSMDSKEYYEATQLRWGYDIDLFQQYTETMDKERKGGSL